MQHRFWRQILLLCSMAILCLLVACGEQAQSAHTATETQTEADTLTESESLSESVAEDETDSETELETEQRGWEADTGIFNDGIVTYNKDVKTDTILAYPDDRLGTSMMRGEEGVKTVFYSDFADNDITVGGLALPREEGKVGAQDGVLIIPYNGAASNFLGGGWTTWTPLPDADFDTYKQVELSILWDIRSVGTNPCTTSMWGCYVSNNTGKIPDNPGDGLWFAFHENLDSIVIYHPDDRTWSDGWTQIPVEKGLLDGKHQLNLVCMPDRTTYVYITAKGGDERLVCTVRFSDGKIYAYDEGTTLIAEAPCTTNALKGDHFTLFAYGSWAFIDEMAILGASHGESTTTTTVTATPTEGHKLGLDMTNRSDLVSICYSVWFDAILGEGTEPITDWHNITEALAGVKDWGDPYAFHYWAKPATGYYRSSDTSVIRTHMTQLYMAGVDFIIIDLTNARDSYLGTDAWISYIQTPMDAILDTIMEMRAEGLGTPYVVFWAGESEGPLYRKLYDHYHAAEKWQDCFVYWDEKPFLLVTEVKVRPFVCEDLFTVRSMWGLKPKYNRGQWSFINRDNTGIVAVANDKTKEQMSVAVASQDTYMSKTDTAYGREGGLFWFRQWQNAFDVHPKVVTITWWNEWTAQRLEVEPGVFHFTDNYNQEYSRDIEPMEGGHGDQYYRWLVEYISAYKGGLDCPILVEDDYKESAEIWLSERQN